MIIILCYRKKRAAKPRLFKRTLQDIIFPTGTQEEQVSLLKENSSGSLRQFEELKAVSQGFQMAEVISQQSQLRLIFAGVLWTLNDRCNGDLEAIRYLGKLVSLKDFATYIQILRYIRKLWLERGTPCTSEGPSALGEIIAGTDLDKRSDKLTCGILDNFPRAGWSLDKYKQMMEDYDYNSTREILRMLSNEGELKATARESIYSGILGSSVACIYSTLDEGWFKRINSNFCRLVNAGKIQIYSGPHVGPVTDYKVYQPDIDRLHLVTGTSGTLMWEAAQRRSGVCLDDMFQQEDSNITNARLLDWVDVPLSNVAVEENFGIIRRELADQREMLQQICDLMKERKKCQDPLKQAIQLSDLPCPMEDVTDDETAPEISAKEADVLLTEDQV